MNTADALILQFYTVLDNLLQHNLTPKLLEYAGFLFSSDLLPSLVHLESSKGPY